ncbi:hypothetical protein SBADM41S_11181 [Streptomyces badius]
MGVQHPQGGEHVGADLGGPVGVEGALGEERGERPGRDELADYPERIRLGEHVEDLVEAGVVGHLGGGLRGLDRPPDRGVRTAADRPPAGPDAGARPSASSTSASTISGNGTWRTRTSWPLYVSNARVSASSYPSDGGSGRR